MQVNPDIQRGVALFNRQSFFEAHEVLEDVWRAAPQGAPSRRHLQGLVQVAGAFHHQSKGNAAGAASVMARALRNLAGAETTLPELDLAGLRREIEVWIHFLDERRSADATNNTSIQQIRLPSIVYSR